MLGLIITLHILFCIFLILIILLQPGKGYGLSESFGGTAQTIFGTHAGTFMTRATAIAAIMFFLTCLSLGIIYSKRGRSLMERIKSEGVQKENAVKESVPPAKENDKPLPQEKTD